MNLRHVALVCSSQENADRLFSHVLGLKKSEPKMLSRVLSKAIFDVDAELPVINYTNDHLHFEVFVDDQHPRQARRIEHTCLAVGDLLAFVQKCRDSGVTVIQVPKGDSLLTFIRDSDGNLFEIKE